MTEEQTTNEPVEELDVSLGEEPEEEILRGQPESKSHPIINTTSSEQVYFNSSGHEIALSSGQVSAIKLAEVLVWLKSNLINGKEEGDKQSSNFVG